MDAGQLQTLARRVRGKFRASTPPGVTSGDIEQDAIVRLLELERKGATPPKGVPLEAFLVQRTFGDLLDKYARDWKRGRKLKTEADGDQERPEPVGAFYMPDQEAQDTKLDIESAISRLSDKEQRCVRLSLTGMTQTEIGDAVGLSQTLVSQILRQAREKMRANLLEYSK